MAQSASPICLYQKSYSGVPTCDKGSMEYSGSPGKILVGFAGSLFAVSIANLTALLRM